MKRKQLTQKGRRSDVFSDYLFSLGRSIFFLFENVLACVKLQKECAGIVWLSALTLQGVLRDAGIETASFPLFNPGLDSSGTPCPAPYTSVSEWGGGRTRLSLVTSQRHGCAWAGPSVRLRVPIQLGAPGPSCHPPRTAPGTGSMGCGACRKGLSGSFVNSPRTRNFFCLSVREGKTGKGGTPVPMELE